MTDDAAAMRKRNQRARQAPPRPPEPDPSWRERAACRTLPNADQKLRTDLFFSSPADHNGKRGPLNDAEKAAIAVCNDMCPVRGACTDYWMANPSDYGLWGGRTVVELRALRRARRAS